MQLNGMGSSDESQECVNGMMTGMLQPVQLPYLMFSLIHPSSVAVDAMFFLGLWY